MITCPICDYHYSEKRISCPTCGAVNINHEIVQSISRSAAERPNDARFTMLVVAHGAERARQLPQSPRFFQLVD